MDAIPGLTAQQMMAASVFVYFLMKWLKSLDWYMKLVKEFPASDAWTYRIVAAVLSFIAAVGVNVMVQPDPVSGGWMVAATIPHPMKIWESVSLFDWGTVFGVQQYVYESTRTAAERKPLKTVKKPAKKNGE